MKTTKENNRLIAEFMGYEFKLVKNPTIDRDGVSHIKDEATVIDGKLYFDNNLRYHSSWDWLMPVVDKIESIDDGAFDINILKNGTQIFEYQADGKVIVDNVGMISFEDKIEHVFEAVIEFIKWYNENK